MNNFVFFMIGLFVGVLLMALFQANRNTKDKERTAHAIKMAKYYKEKCKEMQNEKR